MVFLKITRQYTQDDPITKVIDTWIPPGWETVFKEAREELEHISQVLDKEKEIYPMRNYLFRAFDLTPLKKVRVVIVGQDPYPNIGDDGLPRAYGCSFSVRKSDSIPVSLKNIFKSLSLQFPPNPEKPDAWHFKYPFHGCLDNWARQGVLLLNKCLTVTPGEPGSHGEVWDGFILHVIKAIMAERPNCIFVLWGNEAKKIKEWISDRCIFLEGAHPAARAGQFFEHKHFLQINAILSDMGESSINWNLD